MRFKLRPTHLVVVSGFLFASSLRAEEAAGPGAESANAESAGVAEVVVTAQRKTESLSRVPLSVAAMTQEGMDAANVRSLSDIQQLTPGLQFSPAAGAAGTSSISIRGISSAVGAGTTGIYIDDTPIQIRNTGNGASNGFPQIFDLERVEVLRGPQGTLFGAGAEGGAVRFITPGASLERYSSYARSELSYTGGGEPNYELGGAIGGPITPDKLGFRISAWHRQDGGYVDQVDPVTSQLVSRNSNSKRTSAAKLALTWSPLDALTVTPSMFYQYYDSASRNQFFLTLSDPGSGTYRNGYSIPEPSKDRFVLPALRVQYDFAGASLVANTSYFHRETDSTNDYINLVDYLIGGVAGPVIPNQIDTAYQVLRQNAVSQELRLQSSNPDARLSWVGGLFYSYSRQLSHQYNLDPNFDTAVMTMTAGLPFCPAAGCDAAGLFGLPLLDGNSLFLFDNYNSDEQYAAFGQIDYQIVGGLKLTAGLRYSHLKFRFKNSGAGPFYGPAGTDVGGQSESPVTPKFALSYQFDSALVYASASKGFRPGGSQPPAASAICTPDLEKLGLTSSPTEYNSDNLWSYELGAKLQLLDNRLHVDASVFRIDWKKIQQLIALPSCGGGFITNLGSATSKGFDLAIQFKPNASFLFGGTAGYMDAELTKTIEVSNNALLSRDGGPVGGAGAPWSASLNAEYHRPISARYEGFVRLDGRYQSRWDKPDSSIYGYDPDIPALPSQKQLNAKLGLRFEALEVSLFANNLTNEHSLLALNHDAAGSPLFYGIVQTPRVIGITASYRN